jgi:glycosyltransferase involved in cell wall biosynthesis
MNGINTDRRALVVSSVSPAEATAQRIVREAYSYRFVYRAFAPLLARWGRVAEVTNAESRLDHALWQSRQQGQEPFHLSFLPLHLVYLTQKAKNVVFPFWEFPDIPNEAFGHMPRNNWVHVAQRLSLILTATTFTKTAFERAGVTTPVRVVPVPIRPEYFQVPAWQPTQRVVIDCPCHVVPYLGKPGPELDPWVPSGPGDLTLRQRLRYTYLSYVRPRLPRIADDMLTQLARARIAHRDKVRPIVPASPKLELSGVVYTTILNPFDFRKNIEDLLNAYLFALRHREDATLVIKLVVCPELATAALNGLIRMYQHIGADHRCKIVFVTAYLTDAQMVDLARATTYYVSATRAEGANLPLQDFLAAGRPGVSPNHTAMADYFDDDLGLVVPSHPEPAHWPLDPDEHHRTTWHRIVWQALHDGIQESYDVARAAGDRYSAWARSGRERMLEYASAERVWPHLSSALDSAHEGGRQTLDRPAALRKAS